MPKKLPPVPAIETLKFRKNLSAPGLLKKVRTILERLTDHRTGKLAYTLTDVLMSALAMFGLKYPSLRKEDKNRHELTIKNHLKQLYGVKNVPCDTQMRSILDPVDPEILRSSFLEIHHQVQRGKVLEAYKYLGGYLMSLDATGQFSSTNICLKSVVVDVYEMAQHNIIINYLPLRLSTLTNRMYSRFFQNQLLAKMGKPKMIVNSTRLNVYSRQYEKHFPN